MIVMNSLLLSEHHRYLIFELILFPGLVLKFIFCLFSPPKKKPQLKRQMSVSQLVLQWCKEQTEEYEVLLGIRVVYEGWVGGSRERSGRERKGRGMER